MKNLILVILLCAAGYGAKAQVSSLIVTNTTSNTIYIVLRGGPGLCTLGSNYTMALAPFSGPTTINSFGGIPPLSWPGGSFINQVAVYASVPGSFCAPSPVLFYSSGCTGSSLSPSTFTVLNASCTPTGSATANWIPRTTPGGTTASLSFN